MYLSGIVYGNTVFQSKFRPFTKMLFDPVKVGYQRPLTLRRILRGPAFNGHPVLSGH